MLLSPNQSGDVAKQYKRATAIEMGFQLSKFESIKTMMIVNEEKIKLSIKALKRFWNKAYGAF